MYHVSFNTSECKIGTSLTIELSKPKQGEVFLVCIIKAELAVKSTLAIYYCSTYPFATLFFYTL